jgi:hypothetical protein
MRSSQKSAAQPPLLTYFEVNEYGTITDPSVPEPTVRSEVFKDLAPARICSMAKLIDEVEACTPLASYFSRLADERLSEIQEELDDRDNPLGLIERRRLGFLAERLRDEPDNGWQDWLQHEGDPGLAGFKEIIQDWLDDEINWNESDWFDSDWSRQSASLHFFSCLDCDVNEALGVVIVEGEHPGSSYYAAELRADMEQANEAAQALGFDFRFRAVGEVDSDEQVQRRVAANQGASA